MMRWMDLRPFLWMLPLAAGLGAYWLAAGPPPDAEAGGAEVLQGRRLESHPISTLGALEEEIQQIRTASSRPAAEQFPQDVPTGDLKERILALWRKHEASGHWRERDRLFRQLVAAVRRLGEQGGTHLAWMKENHPEGIPYFMDAWAEKDPGAALDHITSSTEPRPCSRETLMKALAKEGMDHPGGFLERVNAVPWENFLFTDDPFGRSLQVGSKEEAGLWIDSGAARALLERGVEIGGLYTQWAERDPGAAMQAWSEWGDPRTDASIGAFRELLKARSKEPEEGAAFIASLSRLDEASLARWKTAWAILEKKRPWAARELRETLPSLQSWSSSGTAPSP